MTVIEKLILPNYNIVPVTTVSGKTKQLARYRQCATYLHLRLAPLMYVEQQPCVHDLPNMPEGCMHCNLGPDVHHMHKLCR